MRLVRKRDVNQFLKLRSSSGPVTLLISQYGKAHSASVIALSTRAFKLNDVNLSLHSYLRTFFSRGYHNISQDRVPLFTSVNDLHTGNGFT